MGTPLQAKLGLIIGLAVIAGSANPVLFPLELQSEPTKVSIDTLIIFGGGIIGYALYVYLLNSFTSNDTAANGILRASRLLKGVVFAWILPALIILFWYLPSSVTFSFSSFLGAFLEVVSMAVAGVLAGLAWGGMSKAMHSATLFTVFFMSGTMGELLTEEGGINVFGTPNYFPYYSQAQLLYTGYMMWVISLIPVTFYAVKMLRDLGIF